MKTLACKDLDPSLTCDFVAEGDTDEMVMGMMKKHATATHPEAAAKMQAMSEDDVKMMMLSKMKDSQPTM